MKKAVAYTFIFNNQIFVTEEEKEKENKTLSGLVSICLSLIRIGMRVMCYGMALFVSNLFR